MKKVVFSVLCALLLSFSSVSHAEDLRIGVGLSKPPYVIQETNSGVELDIVRRALEIAGYTMKPHYMPLLRIPHELNGGSLDGGMHIRAHLLIDGFFSEEVIFYRNYAITLDEKDLRIEGFRDLEGKTIISFQNARKFLGEQFANAVKTSKNYAEIANQELQVRMLAAGRAQVAVGDFRIFLHFAQKFEEKFGVPLKLRFHALFQPTPYRTAFRSRQVRDDFDKGLRQLRESGEYEAIMDKYIKLDDLKTLDQSMPKSEPKAED